MKIFLSWSGERSKAVASALREWLRLVLHYVEPWMSQHDIAAGERWSVEVAKELEACNFGIVCLTKENVAAPWLLFEAGALSKQMCTGAVVPFLFDVDYADILKSPLGLFQSKKADRSATLELVLAINARAEKPDDDQRLKRLFDATWPDFEAQIRAIPGPREPSITTRRPQGEILEELIAMMRSMDQRVGRVEQFVQMLDPEVGAFRKSEPMTLKRERLEMLLERRGMSLDDLYRITKLSPGAFLTLIRRGELMEPTLTKVAQALGASVGVLTGAEPVPAEAPSSE